MAAKSTWYSFQCLRPLVVLLSLVLLAAFGVCSTMTATTQRSRLTQPVDELVRVALKGNTHPLAQLEYDRGPVPDSLPAERMFLLLKRPPERGAALRQFLQDAHTPDSARYHKWLKPEQFGETVRTGGFGDCRSSRLAAKARFLGDALNQGQDGTGILR